MGEEIKGLTLKIEDLRGHLGAHRKARFGSKSARLDQLAFKLQEDRELGPAAEAQATERPCGEVDQPSKRKHGPHSTAGSSSTGVDKVLSPSKACSDCGGTLRHLGEDVT